MLGDNDPSGLFPFLPASLVKVKKSLVRHAREFAAEYGMVGQDIRVPIPFSPSPSLFTSLGALTRPTVDSVSHIQCTVFRLSYNYIAQL